MVTLVLGGGGFLGTHVVHRLLQQGKTVRVLGRTLSKLRKSVGLGRAELVESEFSEWKNCNGLLDNVSEIVHLLTSIGPSASSADGVLELRNTILPTLELLAECERRKIETFVFASSGGTVYGDGNGQAFVESSPLCPISFYGHSKVIAESYIDFFSRNHGVNATILRITNPYGPFQDPCKRQGLIAVAFDCLLSDKEMLIFGDGNYVRDFVYCGDVADSVLKAIEAKVTGVFNISSGMGSSVNEVLETIELLSNRTIRRRYIESRPSDVRFNVLNNNLASSELGWLPRVGLDEGIAKTWEWIQSRPD